MKPSSTPKKKREKHKRAAGLVRMATAAITAAATAATAAVLVTMTAAATAATAAWECSMHVCVRCVSEGRRRAGPV